MRKVLIAGLLAAGMTVVLSSQSFSQGTGGASGATGGATGGSTGAAIPVPQRGPGFAAGSNDAPIGQRQPTAQDVPQNENSAIDAMTKMDKELDRKHHLPRLLEMRFSARSTQRPSA